tara:strand:- start:286 stop:693 length:408 start_codon:yes stop_codon:yes gene_type:complete
MEILIYISGLLTALGTVIGIIAFKLNTKYVGLLSKTQSISNISSIRNAECNNKFDDLKMLIGDIQNAMEKDQYENLAEINGKLKETILLAERNNRKIGENAKVFNKNVTDAFTQIQQLRGNIKALSQDPNMSSNY